MVFKIILLLLLTLSLDAKSISARYDVTFSVFGKIGEAKVMFEQEDGRYHIKVDGGLTGTAASIGQNRREIHESFGVIQEGVLLPELYKKQELSDFYHYQTYFVFYPDDSPVQEYRIREKTERENRMDIAKMRFYSEEVTHHSSSQKDIIYKAHNDLLSLFFNVRTYLKDIPEGASKVIHAVGGRNDKGEILVSNPTGKKRQELQALMPKHENRLITVVIDQDIFKSDKGELFISLDKNYLAKEAMLKDVLLFGDIHGYRTSIKGAL